MTALAGELQARIAQKLSGGVLTNLSVSIASTDVKYAVINNRRHDPAAWKSCPKRLGWSPLWAAASWLSSRA